MNYGKKKALYAASVSRINLMPQAGAQPNDPSPPSPDDGEDSDKESVKRKSRNMSEKKRRDQFNLLVNELCAMVSGNNRKMDKTSVLKSTISFLRIHNDMAEKSHAHEIREDWKPPFLSNDEFTQLMLEALDGFLLVVTQGGTILFASESVTSLLNHLPSDLVNQSLYNFTHADERMKIYQLLSQHKVVPGNGVPDYEMDENQLQFTCHLKCGTTLPDEHCVYELVECTGNFRRWSGERITDSDDLDLSDLSGRSAEEVCFCCTIRLKRSQLIRELSVVDDSKKEFTSRMSLEWSFLFLDHRGPPIIGYLPFEVLGTSGYDYYHPDDLENIAQSHEQLMQTGEGTSCHYRFLTKGQQWIWLQTRFYITYHQWNSKPEFIVCTNTVVSYAEVRNSLRERHVADNINAGNESLKSEINSPSNPDTTNNTVWILGTQTLPSPAPSRRSVTASDFSEVGGDTSEASKLQTQTVCPQYATALTSQISVQSPTEESADNIKSPISSILSAPTSALSREVNVSSQEQAPVSLVEEGQNTSDVALTPVQSRLKQQLLQKHQQLQEAILRQQEELKLISEQLNLSTPAAISSSHVPSIAGTPMILEHAIMPSIGTTSNSANLIPTAISTNSMIPVTPVTPIPMVLQPQQVVLSMPSGALLTAPVTTSGSNTSLQAQQDNAVNDPSHQLGQVRRRGNPP